MYIYMCLVAQSCSTLCDPIDCSPTGSSVHGDSPGKNTEVGCHALLQGIFQTQGWKQLAHESSANLWFIFDLLRLLHSLCLTLCDLMDCIPPGSSVHGDSPGKNTAVGCHALLQGIFTPPGLPHCRGILYHLSHQGSPHRRTAPRFPTHRNWVINFLNH